MQLGAVVTTSACVFLAFALCDAASKQFTLIGRDRQFDTFWAVREVNFMSLTQCTFECLSMGTQCGSFSYSQTKKCKINVMRIQTQYVQLFDVENGTLMYSSLSGDVLPHGNIALKETASHLYLLSLSSVSWYEAFEICQQFGDGFYLASIDDADELDSLRSWFISVPNARGIWLSGTDENHEGCWVWAAPIITKLKEHFLWKLGEPNNVGGKEHCMYLRKPANWQPQDISCVVTVHYLCKRAVNATSNFIPTAEQAKATDIC